MTEEIIIDVSNCSHKIDDDCMEVPICNEYGDLMGYQSCEAQTLCPYRSQKKIERLEQLKNKYYQQTLDDEITISDLITKCNDLEQENEKLKKEVKQIGSDFIKKGDYARALEQENFALTQESQQKSQTICDLEQENKELKEKLDKEEYNACCECTNIQNQNDKYRSALEEIREIAMGIMDDDIEETSSYYDANSIITKINEVLK